jgi:hypothetical protein
MYVNIPRNHCGDTVHNYVACVYWTWNYNPSDVAPISCWVWWYPDSGTPVMLSGSLFLNETGEGGNEGFAIGFSDIGLPAGYAGVRCQSWKYPAVQGWSYSSHLQVDKSFCSTDPTDPTCGPPPPPPPPDCTADPTAPGCAPPPPPPPPVCDPFGRPTKPPCAT